MRVETTNLLEAVKLNSEIELQKIARESGSWERLFHLSDNRANVVEWLEIAPGTCALEIGAQAGAISAVMGTKYDRYVAIDISEDMAKAFKARKSCQSIDYITSSVYEYAQMHKSEFDDIYIIGSLSEAKLYLMSSNNGDLNTTDIEKLNPMDCAEELMRLAKIMLKPNGRLIVAAENKLGMKYWAGCQEDNNGGYYINIESYPNGETSHTFSKKEIQSMLSDSGFVNNIWYYPYPDMYFANSIYSDKYLPQKDELISNINNYNRDRYLFFDEGKAYNSIIDEGLYDEFANSFLVIAYNDSDIESKTSGHDETIYVKYSKERDRKFAIRTDIKIDEYNKNYVIKQACYEEGKQHIKKTADSYKYMVDEYDSRGLELNKCSLINDELRLEFVNGQNLQTIIDSMIRKGELSQAEKLFDEYVNRCFFNVDTVPFETSNEFEEIYGQVELGEETLALSRCDMDMICSNIFIDRDIWNVIDYEWSADFMIPRNYLLYRALFLAHHQIARCNFLELDTLMAKYGITADEQKIYEEMEQHFQEYVRGDVISNAEIHSRIGKEVYTINSLNELELINSGLEIDKKNMEARIEQLLKERSFIKAVINKLKNKNR